MLDSYIIERIRRERQQPESRRQPLQIETPADYPYGRDDSKDDEPKKRDEQPERGVAIIDFTL